MSIIRSHMWSNKRGDCKEGEPGLMANLYLYEIAKYESVGQVASGLRLSHPKNVSTRSVCIHLVMRSTSC